MKIVLLHIQMEVGDVSIIGVMKKNAEQNGIARQNSLVKEDIVIIISAFFHN
jgi:hypothetical protein